MKPAERRQIDYSSIDEQLTVMSSEGSSFFDALGHGVAGGIASVASLTLLYPLDNLRTRLQVVSLHEPVPTSSSIWSPQAIDITPVSSEKLDNEDNSGKQLKCSETHTNLPQQSGCRAMARHVTLHNHRNPQNPYPHLSWS